MEKEINIIKINLENILNDMENNDFINSFITLFDPNKKIYKNTDIFNLVENFIHKYNKKTNTENYLIKNYVKIFVKNTCYTLFKNGSKNIIPYLSQETITNKYYSDSSERCIISLDFEINKEKINIEINVLNDPKEKCMVVEFDKNQDSYVMNVKNLDKQSFLYCNYNHNMKTDNSNVVNLTDTNYKDFKKIYDIVSNGKLEILDESIIGIIFSLSTNIF